MTTWAGATTTTTYHPYASPPRPATPTILSAMASPFEPSIAFSPIGIASTSATMDHPTAQDWYILRSLHQQIYAYQHALFRPHDGPPAIAPVPMHVAIPPPPNTSSSSSSSSSLFPFALPSGSPPPRPSVSLPANLDSPHFAPGFTPGMEKGMQAPPEQQQQQTSQRQPTRARKISKSKRLEKQLKQGLLRRKQLQQENLLLNYDSDSTPTANKNLPVSSTTIIPPAVSDTATHSTPAPDLALASTDSIPAVPLAEEALPVGGAPLSTASDDQVRSEQVLRAMLQGGLARSKDLSTKQPATTSNSATLSLPPNSTTTHAGNENAAIANGTKDKGKAKALPQEIEVITLDDDDDEIEEGEILVDPVERRKSLTTQLPAAKKTTTVPIPIPFPSPRPKKRRKSFEVEIEDMDESPPRGDFEYDQVPRGPRHQFISSHQGHDPTSPSSHVIMASPPPLLAPPWPSRMYDQWAEQKPGEVVRPSYESSQPLSKPVPRYPPPPPSMPPPPPPEFSYPPPPPPFSHPPPYLQQYQHQYHQQPQSQPFPHAHAHLHLFPPPFPSPSPSLAPYQYPYQSSPAPTPPNSSHPYHGYEPPPPERSPHLHPHQYYPGQAGPLPPPSSYFPDPRPPPGFYGTNPRPPF